MACRSFYAAVSSPRTVQTWSVQPASMADVIRIVWWTRQKLYHTKNTSTIAFRFANFLLNPFVRRVNRRSCIRTVRLARSMCDVEMRDIFGLPLMNLAVVDTTLAGGRAGAGGSRPWVLQL